MNSLHRAVILLCTSLLLAACGGGDSTGPRPTPPTPPGGTTPPSDNVAPTFASASLAADGTTLTVQLTEAASAPILPATGVTGFSVQVAGNARTVSSAARSGNTAVVLTLASPVYTGEAVAVSYAGGNVTDSASPANAMAAFKEPVGVTNNSAQSPPPIQPAQPGQPAPPPPSTPTDPPPSAPSNPNAGVTTFTVSGALEGKFEAGGEFQPGNSSQIDSYAAGSRSGNRLLIAAYQRVGTSSGNRFVLQIRNLPGTGTVNIVRPEQCTDATTTPCASGRFIFDTAPNASVSDDQTFTLTTGTVSVSTATAQRVSGTFSGQATRSATGETVNLSNGGFDVPLSGLGG